MILLGGSLSTLNLPITSDAYQNTTDGNDFYLAVINENLDSLEYATYLLEIKIQIQLKCT